MPIMGGKHYSVLIGMDVLGGASNQLYVIGINAFYKCITVCDTVNSECHVIEYKCEE